MTNTGLVQSFSQIEPNVLGLETSVTSQICEGLNRALASFQLLYLQYQKHHFTVQGAEFYSLHEFFEDSYGAVKDHAHDLGERLDGLGGVPVAHPLKLVELSCFAIEDDGVFNCRTMLEHDLAAEQAILTLLRRLTAQAESLGDRATRYLLEGILLKTEERAYHIAHFLAPDSLKLA